MLTRVVGVVLRAWNGFTKGYVVGQNDLRRVYAKFLDRGMNSTVRNPVVHTGSSTGHIFHDANPRVIRHLFCSMGSYMHPVIYLAERSFLGGTSVSRT